MAKNVAKRLIIAIISISSLASASYASSMQPQRQINEHLSPISMLFAKGRVKYIEGYPDGSFRPDSGVTRAEAAAMLYNLVEDPNKEAQIQAGLGASFNDVADVEWYSHIVAYVAAKGIMGGYSDDEFRPEASITRADMAKTLSELFAGFLNYTYDPPICFFDVPKDQSGHMHINACASFGWIEGYPDGTFRPEEPVTRAEAVTILNRALGRGAYPEELHGDTQQFTDLDEGHWAYAQIMEASTQEAASADGVGSKGRADGGGLAGSGEAQDGGIGDEFAPGELIVGMKEKTDPSTFVGMFPELQFENIEDLYEKAKSGLDSDQPSLSDRSSMYSN